MWHIATYVRALLASTPGRRLPDTCTVTYARSFGGKRSAVSPFTGFPGASSMAYSPTQEIDAWLLGQSDHELDAAAKQRPSRKYLVGITSLLLACLLIAFGWHHSLGSRDLHSQQIHALAVLPLQNLSGDSTQDYFSDGVTEALITDLAQIHALRVISRTSVMQYKQTTKPLPRIADELGADAVVEGAVLRAGGRVRITVQLVEARKDEHLWAASFEGEPGDVLALQRTVSQAIVQAVRATLTPQERERLAHFRPVNAQAYDLYLKGRFFWNKRNLEGFDKAIEYLNQAVQKDPSYAAAYAGLADAYTLHGLASAPANDLPLAKQAAVKAVELDDALAEGHTSLGGIKALYDWDWTGSEREFKRALELNPNYATAHHWYSTLCLGILRRNEEALAELKLAHELDPLSLPIFSDFASTYQGAGQFDKAIELYHQIIDMDRNFAPVHFALSVAYEKKRMYREALIEYREGERLSGTKELLPVAFEQVRTKSDYQRAVRWELDREERESKQPGFWRYDTLARCYARLGEKDRAFTALNTAVEQHDPLAIFLADLQYDELRSDPRMEALLHRMNLVR